MLKGKMSQINLIQVIQFPPYGRTLRKWREKIISTFKIAFLGKNKAVTSPV